MEPEQRVHVILPAKSLHRNPVAQRVRWLGRADISSMLREGSEVPWAVLSVGLAERWVAGNARYDSWHGELRPNLVEPDDTAPNDGHVRHFASLWEDAGGAVAIVFECHH